LILIDQKNGLEISVRELSISTNFDGQEILNLHELLKFCQQVNFPSHGLILRRQQYDSNNLVTGITDWNLLESNFKKSIERFGTAFVETDMRAMYNPMRMEVIRKACQQLIKKINTLCPGCNAPGFGVIRDIPGLPCKQCNMPTRSIKSHIYACQKCSFFEERALSSTKVQEEPMYCDYCNP
jgi:hypothetical protein